MCVYTYKYSQPPCSRISSLSALITENCIDLNKINHFMYNTRARAVKVHGRLPNQTPNQYHNKNNTTTANKATMMTTTVEVVAHKSNV